MAGGWTNTAVDELSVPSTVPFAPGNDALGIGTQVPPELIAAGIKAALVMYNSSWNTASTTPATKFQFIASVGGSIVFGIGYSNNPSTTPTATVAVLHILGEAVGAPGDSARLNLDWLNAAGNLVASLTETPAGVRQAGDGLFVLYDHNGNPTLQFDAGFEMLFIPNGDPLGYSSWQNCTLVNGWAAAAAPSFNRHSGVQCRRLPDGTVYMRGVAAPGITTAGTYICQLPSSLYWPSAGQIFTLYTVGGPCRIVIDSGNGAITLLAGGTPSTEVEFDCSWTTL